MVSTGTKVGLYTAAIGVPVLALLCTVGVIAFGKDILHVNQGVVIICTCIRESVDSLCVGVPRTLI